MNEEIFQGYCVDEEIINRDIEGSDHPIFFTNLENRLFSTDYIVLKACEVNGYSIKYLDEAVDNLGRPLSLYKAAYINTRENRDRVSNISIAIDESGFGVLLDNMSEGLPNNLLHFVLGEVDELYDTFEFDEEQVKQAQATVTIQLAAEMYLRAKLIDIELGVAVDFHPEPVPEEISEKYQPIDREAIVMATAGFIQKLIAENPDLAPIPASGA